MWRGRVDVTLLVDGVHAVGDDMVVRDRLPVVFEESYYDRAPETLRALRGLGPVHRVVMADGVPAWVVVRYEDARRLLVDERLGKCVDALRQVMSTRVGTCPGEAGMFQRHMLFADGAEHARLRGVLAPHFSAAAVRAWRPEVERLARRRLASLAEVDGPVDLVARFAVPFPLDVIGRMFGIAEEDQERFRGWTEGLMQDAPERRVPASRAMTAAFTGLIESYRRGPGAPNLVRSLVEAGELTDEELIGTLFLLLVAGHETATHLIGNSVRWLVEDREWWSCLVECPETIPSAVELLLRFDGPVAYATHRFTREPVTVGETTIPAGEIVLIGLMSANRDVDRFPAGDRLDMWDPGQGHLAFGRGPHYCLGAALGRMEAEIALRLLTSQFPEARLAVDAESLRRTRTSITNGYQELPVLLRP